MRCQCCGLLSATWQQASLTAQTAALVADPARITDLVPQHPFSQLCLLLLLLCCAEHLSIV